MGGTCSPYGAEERLIQALGRPQDVQNEMLVSVTRYERLNIMFWQSLSSKQFRESCGGV